MSPVAQDIRTPLAAIAVALVLFLTVSACEEDVTAVVGTELPYTLFGVLSPQLDSQWVRVYPVENRLTPALNEPLDADVVSTDLTTGEKVVWRDSVIVDFANQFAHVYWAPFRAEHEHTYQIEVNRSDGERSGVAVTVPPASEIIIETPRIFSTDVVLPVLIPGEIPRLLSVEVDFAIAYLPFGAEEIISNRLTIQYLEEPRKVAEGWRIPINLREAYLEISQRLATTEEPLDARVGILLLNTTIRMIVGNAEWNPPDGIFNLELLVQPGVMENVDGGFGFVGAGYRMHRQWIPPDSASTKAGFRPPGES